MSIPTPDEAVTPDRAEQAARATYRDTDEDARATYVRGVALLGEIVTELELAGPLDAEHVAAALLYRCGVAGIGVVIPDENPSGTDRMVPVVTTTVPERARVPAPPPAVEAAPYLGDLVVDLESDRYLFDGERYEAVDDGGTLLIGSGSEHDWTEVARFAPGRWLAAFRERAARGAT